MTIAWKPLPQRGSSADDLLSAMEAARDRDVRWRDGRVFSLVFHPGDELAEFSGRAYGLFMSENGLNPAAFPSLRRFEVEVVSMVGSLLHGGVGVVGNMTSGGTESILMAVKAAREWGRSSRITRPQMVLPSTAHPAFDKAAHYFGVEAVHVPVGKDFRADVRAMRKALTRSTVLVVGSAPSYPQGVVDPIEDLARMAAKRGILMHVDACVGGMMLPFVRSLGHAVPAFDFEVPGVTSMSVDLHKYGYAAKGTSVVLYRNAALRRHQYFAYTDWPGGIYVSPTMTGTRPGGAIAAAWAMLHRLGYEGYEQIAREVMDATTRIRRGVEAIDGVRVLGDPPMSVLAIAGDGVDIYEVGDRMTELGWHLDRQQSPPSLHLTVNRAHVTIVDRFLEDLRRAVKASRKEPFDRLLDRSKLLAAAAVMRVLPSSVAGRVTAFASKRGGLAGSSLPRKTAPMYGLMAALPNRGDLRELVIDALDRMTRPDTGGTG